MRRKSRDEAYAVILVGGRGKRLRPLIVLASGEILGVGRTRLMPVAAAAEIVHNFSLIHDDLPAMDDDDFRRGKPTCHKAFDEATAVLAGDALLTLGFGLLARAGRTELAGEMAEAIGSRGMAGGQALDMLLQQGRLSAEKKQLIDEMKTGRLFRFCFRAPLAFVRVPAPRARLMSGLGDDFGVAFQIRDDIEDAEGDASLLREKLQELRDRMEEKIRKIGGKTGVLEYIIDSVYPAPFTGIGGHDGKP